MEQLRQQLPVPIIFISAVFITLLACILIIPLPLTVLFLPLIAYCCYRLYIQLQHEQLDPFNLFFEVGCVLAAVTLFITTHTAFY